MTDKQDAFPAPRSLKEIRERLEDLDKRSFAVGTTGHDIEVRYLLKQVVIYLEKAAADNTGNGEG